MNYNNIGSKGIASNKVIAVSTIVLAIALALVIFLGKY